jgi:hypothetical protein
MARNGSGTMSVVNSFTANTTISSSEMNANFSDFASEVTNSLPRDGQAAMTGVLKLSAGTVAAPGLAFSTDTDTGIYRSGANEAAVAVGGVIGAKVVATGGTLYASGSAVGSWDSTGLKDGSGENYDAFAAGTSLVFYQASAPTGWTAESINDKALRVVSAGGTGGTDGGTTAFSSIMAARTITTSEIPDLTITITDPGHTHSYTKPLPDSTHPTGSGRTDPPSSTSDTTGSSTTGITAAFGTTARGGAQTAMDFAVQYSDVIIATKD